MSEAHCKRPASRDAKRRRGVMGCTVRSGGRSGGCPRPLVLCAARRCGAVTRVATRRDGQDYLAAS
eukprot:5828759-Pleurochrysis_carterae.AAC.2